MKLKSTTFCLSKHSMYLQIRSKNTYDLKYVPFSNNCKHSLWKVHILDIIDFRQFIKDCKADDRDEPGRESRRFDYLQNSRTSTFGWFILSISIFFFCFLQNIDFGCQYFGYKKYNCIKWVTSFVVQLDLCYLFLWKKTYSIEIENTIKL